PEAGSMHRHMLQPRTPRARASALVRALCLVALSFPLAAGCLGNPKQTCLDVEAQVAGVSSATAPELPPPCTPTLPVLEKLDLAEVWSLTLEYNPELRQAAAEVEMTRGRRIQAALYPNPKVQLGDEEIGTDQGPAGNPAIQVQQDIVTSGKRDLDVAI